MLMGSRTRPEYETLISGVEWWISSLRLLLWLEKKRNYNIRMNALSCLVRSSYPRDVEWKEQSKPPCLMSHLGWNNFWSSIDCCFWPISSTKMDARHKSKVGYLIFLHDFDFFSASKSCFLTMGSPLTSMTSKTALPNILKIASNQCISSKEDR